MTFHSDLFSPIIGREKVSLYWYESKDGCEYARSLFHRHYSYKKYADGRDPKRFVGPGERIVLIREQGLFVWRKFISGDNQEGVGCSIFRNESKEIRSSDLILDAEEIAIKKWGSTRLYTYVNAAKTTSQNPGYCFKCAGWKTCGITKINKLVILEKTIS